jgi:hypothetical protein
MAHSHFIESPGVKAVFRVDPDDESTWITAQLRKDHVETTYLELRTDHRLLTETTGGVNVLNVRAESPVTTLLARQAAERVAEYLNEREKYDLPDQHIHGLGPNPARGKPNVLTVEDLDALVRFAQDNAR